MSDNNELDMNRPYTIKRTLGGGSYGCVFLVECDDKQYAMKRIYTNPTSDQSYLRRQLHELNILCFNRCKYLLQSRDVVLRKEGYSQPNILEIITDVFLEGNLDNFIFSRHKNNQPLSTDTVWSIFLQLCLGVEYLHRNRIIHRDLKPSNILIRRRKGEKDQYDVVICDFGSSIFLGKDLRYCHTKIGTPYFMSPEQYNSTRYDYKTDIWSLGCILYELVMFEKPFTAPNIVMLNYKISKGHYRPLLHSEDNAVWNYLFRHMLEKDSHHRVDIYNLLKIPVVMERMKKLGLRCHEGDALRIPESLDVRVGDDITYDSFIENIRYMKSFYKATSEISVPPVTENKNEEKQIVEKPDRKRAFEVLNDKFNDLKSKLEKIGLRCRPQTACSSKEEARGKISASPMPFKRPRSEYVRTRKEIDRENVYRLKPLKPIHAPIQPTVATAQKPKTHLHPLPPHARKQAVISPYQHPLVHPTPPTHKHKVDKKTGRPMSFVERLRHFVG